MLKRNAEMLSFLTQWIGVNSTLIVYPTLAASPGSATRGTKACFQPCVLCCLLRSTRSTGPSRLWCLLHRLPVSLMRTGNSIQ